MKHWLFKSEPSCFSIDDLKRVKTEHWDGVRNYQARNFLRDECKKGDLVIFYHSSCDVPAAVGVATVTKPGYPDHTAFDPKSEHPDLKSDPDNPRWFMVDVTFKEKFNRVVSLAEMKTVPELADMPLLRKGNRLSLFPISADEFSLICRIGAEKS